MSTWMQLFVMFYAYYLHYVKPNRLPGDCTHSNDWLQCHNVISIFKTYMIMTM